jgi:glycine cleavage system transcriptional repressor
LLKRQAPKWWLDKKNFEGNMASYIMSITARDRSGIVAGLSEALLAMGGNIVAASQTVHQGYFAMIINCNFPGESVDVEKLTDLIHQKGGTDLHVYITDYKPPACGGGDNTSQSFIVTALGPDKPGILHSLATYLAGRDINIDDLYCCVDNGNFVVICQVSVPAGLDIFSLQADLEEAGKERGVVINMQHENIFVATNELPLKRQRS